MQKLFTVLLILAAPGSALAWAGYEESSASPTNESQQVIASFDPAIVATVVDSTGSNDDMTDSPDPD